MRRRTPGARSPRRRGKPPRANPAKELARMKSLALDIEEPLNDAAGVVVQGAAPARSRPRR